MTIKARLRDGIIQPTEPLPAGWADGPELLIEEADVIPTEAELQEWLQEMDAGAAQISAEDNEQFLQAMAEQERESKDAVRREWGLP